jgi:hypothetical protein
MFDFHCHCCTKNTNTPNYIPYHLAKNFDHTHSHLGLMEWVYKYFSQNESSQVSINSGKPQNGNITSFMSNSQEKNKITSEKTPPIPCGPLYFQHQGTTPECLFLHISFCQFPPPPPPPSNQDIRGP